MSAFLLYIWYNATWKKDWWFFLKKVYIDYKIKNNDEILKKENLEAVYKVNEYLKIKDIDENINISFDNGNIIMERDNNESNLLFNFVLDKETESKYFIKNLNFYIDTKVKTNHLQICNAHKNLNFVFALVLVNGLFLYKTIIM